MKYKTFTSNSIVAYYFWGPIVLFLPIFLLFCLGASSSGFIDNLTSFSFVFVGYLHIALTAFLINYNYFLVVTVDSEGIKNRNIKLKWDEIQHIDMVAYELFKYKIIPTVEIDSLCISKEPIKPSRFGSSKCIMLEINKKNLAVLKKYSNGQSRILEEYISSLNPSK